MVSSHSAGSCKVTEFLLSKGIPVDIDCGRGTPLYHAATNVQDKTEDFVGLPCKCIQPHSFLSDFLLLFRAVILYFHFVLSYTVLPRIQFFYFFVFHFIIEIQCLYSAFSPTPLSVASAQGWSFVAAKLGRGPPQPLAKK
jgi:hypothetical protein